MLDRVTYMLKVEDIENSSLSCITRCKPLDQELIAQSMVVDYFDEIVKSDEFVSVFSGFAVLVSLTLTVSLSYMSFFEDIESINSIQGVLFVFLFITISSYMANVYNSSIKVYQKLCAVSAIQKSVPRQRLWTYIQEYYIENQKICYTVFDAIPICLQTQLKVSTYQSDDSV